MVLVLACFDGGCFSPCAIANQVRCFDCVAAPLVELEDVLVRRPWHVKLLAGKTFGLLIELMVSFYLSS
jgi:hypothetical protein